MAKKTLLKYFMYITSLPFRVVTWFVECFDLWGINKDIDICIQTIDASGENNISPKFIDALVIAEDRRNNLHYGVDTIAMIRALYVWLVRRKLQGASTIEQQFVRVVSARYERTILRKFREQILAISVSKRRSKSEIAIAYLSIAFYGNGLFGIDGMREKCEFSLGNANYTDAIGVVARLKYPEPMNCNDVWQYKHSNRNAYIAKQLQL